MSSRRRLALPILIMFFLLGALVVGAIYSIQIQEITGAAPAPGPITCNSCVDCSAKAGTPGEQITLANSISSSGTCIEVIADDVIIDCAGFSITGSDIGAGILLNNVSNTEVKNCEIKNYDYGLQLISSANAKIWHNNIFEHNLNVYSDFGIELSQNKKGNYWGHNSYPYFSAGTDSNAANVKDSKPYGQKNGWIDTAEDFDGDTSNLENLERRKVDFTALSNILLEKEDYGHIKFKKPIDLSNDVQLKDYVRISRNYIRIDTDELAALGNDLDKSAEIKLKRIRVDEPDIYMRIDDEWEVCPNRRPEICNITYYNEKREILYFTVTGFPNSVEYKARELAICGNNIAEGEEHCDLTDDNDCPGRCMADCTCGPRLLGPEPPPIFTQAGYNIIHPGENKTITYDRSDVAFMSVAFTVEDELEDVLIKVYPKILKPTGVRNISEKEFQYFELKLSNIADENISNVKFRFKVDKAWVESEGIDPLTIRLNRYENTRWSALPTTKLSEDNNYHYFEASSLGFSLFVITGQVPPPLPPYIPICGDGVCELNETQENCCIDCDCPSGQECRAGVCTLIAICGNDICEANETITNCPTDCIRQLFFLPSFWAIIIILVVAFMTSAIVLAIRPKPKPKLLKISELKSPEEKLREYIENQLHKGVHIYNIKRRLLHAGWPESLVDKYLREFRP